MEPNKFEEKLRKQLREREIQPSENAWDRIVEQLEEEHSEEGKAPSKRGFHWYGIAAGFIGLLFVSILYFTSGDTAPAPDNQVVTVPGPIIGSGSESDNGGPDGTAEENVSGDAFEGSASDSQPEHNTSDVPIERIRPKDEAEVLRKQKEILQKGFPVENAVANAKTSPDNGAENTFQNIQEERTAAMTGIASEERIQTKIAEIVTQVEGLEIQHNEVSDAEIDSLLRNAQRELLAENLFNNDRSVNAEALLADVENELDQSFRDRIFDALKDGYLKVRTAVADRDK